MKYIY